MGLNAIGFTIYSLPADPQRRVEYCRWSPRDRRACHGDRSTF